METKTGNPMATKSIPSLILLLALPSIVAQIVNILYNIVDRMYVGHMPGEGAIALAALGVCAPLLLIVSAFALLIGGGGAPLAAMALGRENPEDAEKNLGTSLVMLLLLGAVLTGVGLWFLEPLLYLFGASEQTLPYAIDYGSMYLVGTIFVMLSIGLNPFISSQGKAKTAMVTVLIGAVTNIVLDPIFIYGLDMGVRGAALATVISQALSAAFVLYFFLRGYTAGVQPLISFSYGAKRYDRILEALKISLIALTIASMGYYALIFFFPGMFARIFTTDPALLELVKELLPIFMFGTSIFSVQMCAQMLYIGTGQARVSLFMAALRKVILLIPFTFLLPIFFGAKGVIYAEPVADILSVCVSGTLLWIGVRNLKAGNDVFGESRIGR